MTNGHSSFAVREAARAGLKVLRGEAENDDAFDVKPVEVRLVSTAGVHTPGLVDWARHGYRTERDRGEPVGMFIAVLADGYGLGCQLSERVLLSLVRQRIEGETLILTLEGEDAAAWQRRCLDSTSG